MRWRANLLIACWLIWAFPRPEPFAGKADRSITWTPGENPLSLRYIGILRVGFQCKEPKVQVADARWPCTDGELRRRAIGWDRAGNLRDLLVEFRFRDIAPHTSKALLSIEHVLTREAAVAGTFFDRCESQIGSSGIDQERLVALGAVQFAHRL